MPIKAPVRPADHPDYRLDCEEAIDLSVRELVDEAIQAGWRPDTIYDALTSVDGNKKIAYGLDPDPADDPA